MLYKKSFEVKKKVNLECDTGETFLNGEMLCADCYESFPESVMNSSATNKLLAKHQNTFNNA